jgi:putative phage-type endonuclease
MNSRESWLAERRRGVGGSDAAPVLGLSPWSSPLQIYLNKTGELVGQQETEPMKWGHLLEPVILSEYANRTGRIVRRPDTPNGIVWHPELSWMMTTLDGFTDCRRVVEAKTARSGDGWGEDGSDEIPDYYIPQVQHEMAVTGLPVADVAVLIGGSDFRIYTVEADPEFQELMIEREASFWKLVEARIPPAPVSAADVALLFPKDSGRSIEASQQVRFAFERALSLRSAVSAAEKELDGDKKSGSDGFMGLIKSFMGDASALTIDGTPVATWKASKDSIAVDWEAVAREAGASAELIQRHSKVKTGSRRFLFK